jgi:tetratricopeptide (TPR) repeat protein
MTRNYRDDYAEMLKVFEYSDPSTVSVCASDMERAMQKASSLISLKSMTEKPDFKKNEQLSDKDRQFLERKEYNEWVDDSYLLIGKARFYKHEYSDASAVFNYCVNEAIDPDLKTEARIWLSRIANETGNYNESFKLLSESETGEMSKSLRLMYYTTMADLYIKQKKYSEAIDPLEKSISLASGKRIKYRYAYLLAQLYEQTGNSSMSTKFYSYVIKMNPPYDVEFNARIKIAGVFDINSGDSKEINRELEKMLKDSKNKDFQDQIYYALGNISIKEGDDENGISYYRKSAATSYQNQNQKGRSYRAIADLYYKKNDYINAGKFYDSVIFFLDRNHPDYPSLSAKSQNLNALVSQLAIIQREDSLQRVAHMSLAERDALINSIINKVVNDETRAKNTGNDDRFNMGLFYENQTRYQGNIDQEGKWYFYNQTALSFGRSEFRRLWGDRKLEDNWRRSNRTKVTNAQIASTAAVEEIQANGTNTTSPDQDNKKPEFYLRDLPMNDSLIILSNDRLANAYLNAGKVYSERFSEQTKSTEMFESLIARLPSSYLIPEALYNLYIINKDNNGTRAETYRQRLLSKYPDNEFSKILSDPSYYENKLNQKRSIEKKYEEAYELYNKGKIDDAVTLCNEALSEYSKDALAPKFMLLRSYSIAKMNDEKRLREELNILLKSWPGTDESKKAGEIIAYLDQKTPELKVEEEKKIAGEIYIADTTSIHNFVLIISDPAFNINQATFDVISNNIDNYTNKNYRTEGTLVDNKYIMITVSGFSNYNESFNYYKSFIIEKHVRNFTTAKMMTFIINKPNLAVLSKDKNPERYSLFFNEKYLKR